MPRDCELRYFVASSLIRTLGGCFVCTQSGVGQHVADPMPAMAKKTSFSPFLRPSWRVGHQPFDEPIDPLPTNPSIDRSTYQSSNRATDQPMHASSTWSVPYGSDHKCTSGVHSRPAPRPLHYPRRGHKVKRRGGQHGIERRAGSRVQEGADRWQQHQRLARLAKHHHCHDACVP